MRPDLPPHAAGHRGRRAVREAPTGRAVLATAALVLVAVLAMMNRTSAMVPGDPVGIWHGPEDGPEDVLTLVIDDESPGMYVFFVHDSSVEVCDGEPGAIWGRGRIVNTFEESFYMLFWDAVHCVDGSSKPFPGSWFKLWALPETGYVQLDPIEPGDGWVGTRVCDPEDESSGTIWGTDDDDTITGSKGPDVICAGDGDDRIWGRNGDDIVVGGDGDDELYGDNGLDILWGGGGADLLYGGFRTDGVFGGDGDDEVKPQAGHDFGYGGHGADALDGFFGHDRLEGGPGDDHAWGRNGNDLLLGGTGNDFLSGGAGANDTADGGDGRDTCNAETETNCEF